MNSNPQHVTVLYAKLNRFELTNGNIPFAGGPGSLFLSRTFERFPNVTYDIVIPDAAGRTPPIRPSSKLLVLGADGLQLIFGAGGNNLNKQRGFRFRHMSAEAIATYSPIECWEYKDDEKQKVEVNEKEVGATRRKNYLFWAQADFEKLLRPKRTPLKISKFIKPPIDFVVRTLNELPTDYELIIDIETRRSDHCLDCVGLGIISRSSYKVTVFVVPIYDYNDKLSYARKDTAKFWRSLFFTLLRNDITVVGHNLAFDLSVLFHYYHLPFPKKIFDTMLFMARHWPGVDKSLSHAISLYADLEKNHKGDICPNVSYSQQLQLMEYNAQDIVSTAEVFIGQRLVYKEGTDDFRKAVDDTNRTQFITLLMSFTGCNVDTAALAVAKSRLENKINALTRIIRCLVGDPMFNPNSTQQGSAYFYGKLGYEVTETTETGAPKFDADQMYDLQLKQDNPLFALIIAAKEADKQLSSLNFVGYESVRSNV
jgi:hypothetical protein